MTYSTLALDVQDGVASITLKRPQSFNSVNLEMASELAAAALKCSTDDSVRAVLLSGAGRVFCAGGDLKDFDAHRAELSLYLQEVTTKLHTAVSRLVRMRAPVVAAVHGSAAGAGMSLVCACDLVVAAESTRFTMAYTRLGLSPDGSATYFLPRLVGVGRALDLILTNRELSAREALEWGIVTSLAADDEALGVAADLTRRLAAGPTAAFAVAKELLQRSLSETLETQMALETRSIAATAATDDAIAGIRAFVEKREPEFRGS